MVVPSTFYDGARPRVLDVRNQLRRAARRRCRRDAPLPTAARTARARLAVVLRARAFHRAPAVNRESGQHRDDRAPRARHRRRTRRRGRHVDPDPVRAALARSRHSPRCVRWGAPTAPSVPPPCSGISRSRAAGVVLAACVAVALSSRFPVGIGRELELDRGAAANAAVLALGAVLCVFVVLAAAYASGRGAGVDGAARRPNRAGVARWETKVGAPTGVALGTHFALDRPRTPARLRAAARRSRSGASGRSRSSRRSRCCSAASIACTRRPPSTDGRGTSRSATRTSAITDRVASKLKTTRTVSAATVVRYGQAQIDGESTATCSRCDPVAPRRHDAVSGRLPETSQRDRARRASAPPRCTSTSVTR